jgi:hypothetical protein
MNANSILKQCLKFNNNLLNRTEIKELMELFDTHAGSIQNCIVQESDNITKCKQQRNIIATSMNKMLGAKQYNILYDEKPKGAVFYISNFYDTSDGVSSWVTNNDSNCCLKQLKGAIKEGELKCISTSRKFAENGMWTFDIKIEWNYDPTRRESVAFESTVLSFKKKENRDASFQYLTNLNIGKLKITKEKRDGLANALKLSLNQLN